MHFPVDRHGARQTGLQSIASNSWNLSHTSDGLQRQQARCASVATPAERTIGRRNLSSTLPALEKARRSTCARRRQMPGLPPPAAAAAAAARPHMSASPPASGPYAEHATSAPLPGVGGAAAVAGGPPRCKLVLLGDSGVGKSALVQRQCRYGWVVGVFEAAHTSTPYLCRQSNSRSCRPYPNAGAPSTQTWR